MPNAQQTKDFVYDSAETLVFLASPLARSYNTVHTARFVALARPELLRSATSHTPNPLYAIALD